MSTFVDCLAMWGLAQMLLVWCCVRGGDVRQQERQRYLASMLSAKDLLQIDPLPSTEAKPLRPQRPPGSSSPSGP